MSNILDIHISRTFAGDAIPFDKLYLVLPEHKDLIPKIFGYAIVMPLGAENTAVLHALQPDTLTHKQFRRDDANKHVPIIPKDEQGSSIRNRKAYALWWKHFSEEYQMEKRLVVIPILTSIARRRVRPRYLANQKWFSANIQTKNKRQRGLTILSRAETVTALSEFAYLATPRKAPQDKIRPLCAICPRLMLHMQGKCVPGELVCYDALNFNDIPEESDGVSV